MTPLDLSLESVPPEQLTEHMRRLREFIRTTPDPNASGPHGRTCLLFALAFNAEGDGKGIVKSLLDRGADPNRPSAFDVFGTFMTVGKHVEVLESLIRAGLKLNEVYTVEAGSLPTGRGGRVTLLDYALDVQAYLTGRQSKPKKRAEPLAGRRRFVADVISLLDVYGALSAAPGK
jgi:hypothetical protein